MNYQSQIDKLPKLFKEGVECGLAAILDYNISNLEKVMLFGSCGRLR